MDTNVSLMHVVAAIKAVTGDFGAAASLAKEVNALLDKPGHNHTKMQWLDALHLRLLTGVADEEIAQDVAVIFEYAIADALTARLASAAMSRKDGAR